MEGGDCIVFNHAIIPVYIAVATQLAIKKAITAVKGTNIGVMDQNGKIIKRSTR